MALEPDQIAHVIVVDGKEVYRLFRPYTELQIENLCYVYGSPFALVTHKKDKVLYEFMTNRKDSSVL